MKNHIKKTTLLIFSFWVFLFCTIQGQEIVQNNEFAMVISSVYARGTDNSSFNEADFKPGYDLSLHYRKIVKNDFFIQTGFTLRNRSHTGYSDLLSEEFKVKESFMSIPVLVGVGGFVTQEKQHELIYSLGGYIDILISQNQYFQEGVTTPDDFISEYNFGDYQKIGLLGQIRYINRLAPRLALSFAVEVGKDLYVSDARDQLFTNKLDFVSFMFGMGRTF